MTNHRSPPSRRGILAVAALLVAGTGTVVGLWPTGAPEPDPEPDPEPALEAPAPELGASRGLTLPAAGDRDVVQTYSPYCQTPAGICTMASSLPVGATCVCGGQSGRVVP
jgi:hypothetical protein